MEASASAAGGVEGEGKYDVVDELSHAVFSAG
jgi:hypothetical protein